MFTLCWCCLLVAAPDPIAVVALSDEPEVAAAVETVARQRTEAGDKVESQASLATVLTGTPTPRDSEESTLRRMLDDARDREARFDTAGANAVREQILRAFDMSIRPDAAIRALAGEAGLDMAAALVVEEHRRAAARVVADVWRRFPSAPIDLNRHPPATVEFLQAQRERAAARKLFELTVVSDRAGTVFADGTRLGETQGRLDARLPWGSYRIWLEWQGGMSLPHPVNVGTNPVQVTIDADLEHRLGFAERVVLMRCDEDCPARLVSLGKRLGVARVLGVAGPTTHGVLAHERRYRIFDVQVGTGEARESFVIPAERSGVDAELSLVPERRPAFSPLYLVPFGVGQLVQDRPLFAAGYLGIQIGLLGWYAWLRRTVSRAIETGDLPRERELEKRRDMILGLFVAAVAAGAVEAAVVGLVTGE